MEVPDLKRILKIFNSVGWIFVMVSPRASGIIIVPVNRHISIWIRNEIKWIFRLSKGCEGQ